MFLIDLDIGAGDCRYCESILSKEEKSRMFYDLNSELGPYWSEMFHKGGAVPRKIVIQCETPLKGEYVGMEPIYRHPIDVSPPTHQYTQLVEDIRNRTEDLLGFERGYLNHVLIQLYSDGESHISDHSDKTLDIMRGTPVINVSIGAVRKMKIKNKVKSPDGTRHSERIELHNGSVFVMSWETNRKFYHGINQDKRMESLKTDAELDFDGSRISLTFRNIATFVDSDGILHGQGAVKNGTEHLGETDEDEELRMLKAFSAENRETDFDWDAYYGSGFRCINFETLNE
jgi:alkylated DNA repair dioxygenase AlkB